MFMRSRIGAATTALLCLAPLHGALAAGEPFGHWLVENGKAIIEIYQCGEEACGRIAWLRNPLNEDGTAKTDINNPDPAMRTKALCGMTLMRGLERAGPGSWTGGEIYNSRDGSVYSVKMTLAEADELKVRGFLGISLLGRSQVWDRVGGDRGGCHPAAKKKAPSDLPD